jgi:hypothetical protein
MIDLDDYYSGGYFLLRANKPDWPALQTDLLPEKLISLSQHICPRLSVLWGWNPGNKQAALDFGIPQNKMDEFVEWCSAYHADLDIMSMFNSNDAALRFIKRFDLNTSDLYLIGASLPTELEEANWRAESNGKVEGIEGRIEQHLPVETGGAILGFDVTSYAHHDIDCSWLCNHLHQDIFDLYGIHPNQYGLLETQAEAKTVYSWINDPVINRTRAESQLYDYWLLISYPLKNHHRKQKGGSSLNRLSCISLCSPCLCGECFFFKPLDSTARHPTTSVLYRSH